VIIILIVAYLAIAAGVYTQVDDYEPVGLVTVLCLLWPLLALMRFGSLIVE